MTPSEGALAQGRAASQPVTSSARRAAKHERLAEAAARGDAEAFAGLHGAYAPTVHGILLSIVPSQDAADLVQEVFLRAWSSIGSLAEPAGVGGWLAVIARNIARDALRKRRPASLESEPAARVEQEEGESGFLVQQLRELPEAYRETLILRLVEGFSGPEIAERTGLTHGSVRVNLCRGMKLLRERLGDWRP